MRRLSIRSSAIGAVLSAVLIALSVAPAATADKPTREIGGQEDFDVTDQCAFPVRIHTEGVEIVTTFTDKAGNPIKQIVVFPTNTQTLTNLDTGKSITVVSTGPFHGRVEPDGSLSFHFEGHGTFFPNPVTGDPGIWYSSGRLSATFDAGGNLTSTNAAGNLVDLCPQLAP
jgi:hypothetical protein